MTAGVTLDPTDVPAYLIECGLIDPGSVVRGDWTLVDRSSRNRNYHVVSRRGRSYFLKQAVLPSARATLDREAAWYRLVSSEADVRPIRRSLPSLLHHDPERGLLVLTSSRHAEHAAGLRARTLPVSVAVALGQILAVLHRRTSGERWEGRLGSDAAREPPWALSIGVPELPSLYEMSAANLELLRVAQGQADLMRHLDDLRREWRGECVIHGDLKSSNLLVRRGARGPGPGIHVVDWELAGRGDSSWDVGSVLADVVSTWLATAPISGASPPERIPSLTRYPLQREFPWIRAFWTSYARHGGWSAEDAPAALVRGIRFAAARLIQTAFEHSQTSLRPSGYSICLLQLSRNVLSHPHEAAALLFGLRLAGPVRSKSSVPTGPVRSAGA